MADSGDKDNSINLETKDMAMLDRDTDITKILVGIGRLEVKADATNEHLAKLNGSVKTLYEKAEENKAGLEASKLNLKDHQINCTGLKTIQEINRRLDTGNFHGSLEVREKLMATEKEDAERRGEKNASDKWKSQLLIPLFKWLIGGVGLLTLLHANDLLTRLK